MLLKTRNEKIAVAGMLLALGILLPFATSHGFGIPGTVLLPMHIPVLLCGFLCGPLYGGFCGLLLPVLNSFLTGMPAMYPMMPIMAGELAVYGLVSGLLYHKTKLGKVSFGIYPALIGAMLCGRVMYGIIFHVLLFLNGNMKALTVWAAIMTGLPGILIQLLLIPPVVTALRKGRKRAAKSAVHSAINLITEGTASCVVLKDNTIIKTQCDRGIGPVIRLYESGLLADAFVVDKIIGKAAAMVLTLGGVKGCYGVTMSVAAVQWLKEHHVSVQYDKCVEAIINRTGDGICPMEQTVKDIDDPEVALKALKAKMEELRNNNTGRK